MVLLAPPPPRDYRKVLATLLDLRNMPDDIEAAQKRHGLTLTATAAQMGVTKSVLSNWLTGKTAEPALHNVIAAARWLAAHH